MAALLRTPPAAAGALMCVLPSAFIFISCGGGGRGCACRRGRGKGRTHAAAGALICVFAGVGQGVIRLAGSSGKDRQLANHRLQPRDGQFYLGGVS